KGGAERRVVREPERPGEGDHGRRRNAGVPRLLSHRQQPRLAGVIGDPARRPLQLRGQGLEVATQALQDFDRGEGRRSRNRRHVTNVTALAKKLQVFYRAQCWTRRTISPPSKAATSASHRVRVRCDAASSFSAASDAGGGAASF